MDREIRREPLMVEIWYAILSFMLVMFIILDGFAIGAGILQYAVGKTDAERRLVLRAIDPLWRTGWHFCFVASNILLAILIGAALGNVVRGVPLDARGRFTLSFFTN